MSYLQALYETYEQNLDSVGVPQIKTLRNNQTISYMLLPISHTTQTAHIEMTVDLQGNLYDATVVQKENTVLPFTEESGSRAGSNFVPHVLHDKLMFVAKDYATYVDVDEKKRVAQAAYLKQLADWCESEQSHPFIEAIYQYVKKGTVMTDLIEQGILHIDANGQLLKKWNGDLNERPEIFGVIASEQEAAFVRFNVHIPGDVVQPIWRNTEIFDAYSRYYNTKLKDADVCYVTGQHLPRSERHPNKLRNSGDKAKLISANDASGFTFRGRFSSSLQAANISYEASQKAHNALKWLIERQGTAIDGRVFLVWGTKNLDIPAAHEDLSDLEFEWDQYDFEADYEQLEAKKIDLKEDLARQQKALLAGLSKRIHVDEQTNETVYILTIDAATPGRLAILYFRSYNTKLYFEQLSNWHVKTSWRHTRGKDKVFYGAPSFYSIAHAAYGPRPSDKVVKGVMERLLPCVLDQRKIPLDIIKSAMMRASNPQYFSENWEWEQTLAVACALVRNLYEQEEYTVALDVTCKDRDYLFGRLLAVADVLERRALGEEKRATNAMRYMSSFQSNPYRTWSTIQKAIQPYQMRLGEKGNDYSRLIDVIASEIPFEQFNNTPLSGKYLLGYYSQRQDLYTKKSKEGEQQS